jgi:hypothetical protein
MQNRYVAPELKLVGEADEVVLGMLGVGDDYLGQQVVGDLEFLAD